MTPITRHKMFAAGALLWVAAGLSGCSDDDGPPPVGTTVTVANGGVVGNARDASGVLSFKGIPYAAPPVGDLRWKPPQAVVNWTSPRSATAYGNKCWANGSGAPVVADPTISEDCLYLNVWTAAQFTDERRPVMVWLHGGGFQFGTSGDPRWEGANLAKKGVVVVSLNYRLNVFGFLARTDLNAESGGKGSGMYGVQDQLAALQWVKANIAQFGGDPGNVTLMGQSAGAHAVGIISASPLATGLFQKAIGESGAFWESEFGHMPYNAAAVAKGDQLGVSLGATTLTALRALPALQLASVTNATAAPFPTPFGPSLDGYVLTQEPAQRFYRGQQIDVPLLVGQNVNEGLIFAVPGRALPATAAGLTSLATHTFGASNLAQFQALYPSATDAQAQPSSVQLLGDLIIGQQTWTWGVQQQKTGKSPVYAYYFNESSPYTPLAIHVAEVPYVFQNLVPKTTTIGGVATTVTAGTQDAALSDMMSTYWTNFAKSSDPNQPVTGLPSWPRYAGAGSNIMGLGVTVGSIAEPFTARYQFLNTFRNASGSLTIVATP